jgi:hypothetical protein
MEAISAMFENSSNVASESREYSQGDGAYSTELCETHSLSSSESDSYIAVESRKAVSPGGTFIVVPEPSSKRAVRSGPLGRILVQSEVTLGGWVR